MLRALSIDRKPESRTRLTVLHSYLPASGLREAEPALPLGAWPLPVRRQVGDHRDLGTDYVPTGADSDDVEVTRSVGAPPLGHGDPPCRAPGGSGLGDGRPGLLPPGLVGPRLAALPP